MKNRKPYRYLLGLSVLILMSVVTSVKADRLLNRNSAPKGFLVVNQMTEGQLLHLKGRVGQGRYSGTDHQERPCSIDLPVAIGSTVDTGIGIHSTDGLKIVVVSQKLNDAIFNRERIVSSDWVFVGYSEDESKHSKNSDGVDGYIIHGISREEGFVINGRRKWISWFLGEIPSLECQ
jgi:hypothetical protein